MPLQEEKTFINDHSPNMTTDQKNMQLSAELAAAPYVKMKIVRVERIDIGAQGWWIHHDTGAPE